MVSILMVSILMVSILMASILMASIIMNNIIMSMVISLVMQDQDYYHHPNAWCKAGVGSHAKIQQST
jgi:hypothetical protein